MRRQRRLDQNPVNRRGGVELREPLQEVRFRGGFRQHLRDRGDPEPRAHPLLHGDIDLRGRIFAQAHKGKVGLHTALFQGGDALGGLGVDLVGDGTAVHEIGPRHQRTT